MSDLENRAKPPRDAAQALEEEEAVVAAGLEAAAGESAIAAAAARVPEEYGLYARPKSQRGRLARALCRVRCREAARRRLFAIENLSSGLKVDEAAKKALTIFRHRCRETWDDSKEDGEDGAGGGGRGGSDDDAQALREMAKIRALADTEGSELARLQSAVEGENFCEAAVEALLNPGRAADVNAPPPSRR